jgi:hypothetical protein
MSVYGYGATALSLNASYIWAGPNKTAFRPSRKRSELEFVYLIVGTFGGYQREFILCSAKKKAVLVPPLNFGILLFPLLGNKAE